MTAAVGCPSRSAGRKVHRFTAAATDSSSQSRPERVRVVTAVTRPWEETVKGAFRVEKIGYEVLKMGYVDPKFAKEHQILPLGG